MKGNDGDKGIDWRRGGECAELRRRVVMEWPEMRMKKQWNGMNNSYTHIHNEKEAQ